MPIIVWVTGLYVHTCTCYEDMKEIGNRKQGIALSCLHCPWISIDARKQRHNNIMPCYDAYCIALNELVYPFWQVHGHFIVIFSPPPPFSPSFSLSFFSHLKCRHNITASTMIPQDREMRYFIELQKERAKVSISHSTFSVRITKV